MLSVVIPVYNVEPYLERCLDSILVQSYQPDEIICVDDGSTDKGLEILKKYAEKDKRFKVIHKENGGVVSARKAGILVAEGRYSTCIDPDDWIEKDMFEKLMKKIMLSDADMVTSGAIREYGHYRMEDNELLPPGVYEGDKLLNDFQTKIIATDVFFENNIKFVFWGKIFRTDLLRKYQLLVDDRINVGDDAACVFACMLNAKKVVVSGENYYHYCIRHNSIMGTIEKNELSKIRILFDYLYGVFAEKKETVSNIMVQYEILKLYFWFMRGIENAISYKQGILFPFGKIDKFDRVILYGKGRIGAQLKQWIENNTSFEIVDWVDSADANVDDVLFHKEYDKIIVVVIRHMIHQQIKNELIEKGIEESKIYTMNVHCMECDKSI